MGPLGAIFGLSAVAGPLLGGFFVDHLTWEWAFYINIPIGIAAFAIAWFTLTLPNKKAEKRIDILGVVLLSAATTCLIFFTDFGGKKDEGWDSPLTWAFGAGMVLSAAAFVMVERRAEDPIIPLSLFRNRIFVNATAIGFTLGLGMFSAIAFVPTFLQMSSGIIADIVPAKDRGKYMGPLGAIFGLSAVAGPLLGGFFVDHLTWEWAFYINIPIGIAAFAIAWFTLTLPNKKAEKRIDILGVVLLSAATTCLIFFTDFGGKKDEGWDSPLTWAFGAGMVLSAAAFVVVERRAEDPIIPLSLFRNRIFVNATAIGFTLGLGMFSAIAFVPTFLQMSSGTSTPIWVICVQLFIFGAGLGLIMQVVVLVVQNSVPADQIGTATSTNNYFREVGAAMGVAVFGAIFTNRLSESLTSAFTGAGASADQAAQSTSTLDPQALSQLPDQLRDAIVNAYAESLAPVFWYLIPFIAVALILAVTLKQIPLSDTAGMVARGEAVGGEEAERLAAGLPVSASEGKPAAAGLPDNAKDDDGELVSQRN
ncbi:MFS transporter [Pseudarthrobacter sp. R1]|uniref:MFS transporter n=1 Tax=Pseudarthrobacter sp. R1 TaxID=2944934 RepID=UPI00210EEA31|nr:MFS transporter [Pseudarthrobacter sp. R1]MCQ6269785.1 MFS transporter [Pseudarthrobacter sp. R1]